MFYFFLSVTGITVSVGNFITFFFLFLLEIVNRLELINSPKSVLQSTFDT